MSIIEMYKVRKKNLGHERYPSDNFQYLHINHGKMLKYDTIWIRSKDLCIVNTY